MVLVAALDQGTKTLAAGGDFAGTGVAGLLRVRLVRNPGAAFGLAPTLTPLFTVAAGVAVLLCLRYGWRSHHRSAALGLGLIAGGAAGNLVDRLARAPGPFHGAVVDWIQLSFYPPAFNLADVALRLGVALLLVRLLRRQPRGAHSR